MEEVQNLVVREEGKIVAGCWISVWDQMVGLTDIFLPQGAQKEKYLVGLIRTVHTKFPSMPIVTREDGDDPTLLRLGFKDIGKMRFGRDSLSEMPFAMEKVMGFYRPALSSWAILKSTAYHTSIRSRGHHYI